MWREIANAVRDLHRTFGEARNPYRPEQHYMRGPGPACRAKSAATATAGSMARTDSNRALADIAGATA
jgi:hypothetical protein